MKQTLYSLDKDGVLHGKDIFLFGHCEATLKLIDLLFNMGLSPTTILDNSPQKWGITYRGVSVRPPDTILLSEASSAVVCIVSRFYEQMYAQLRKIGYCGNVFKLVDYNSFAEYSLSEETICRKRARAERGLNYLRLLKAQYPGAYFIFCPFQALGDVYLAMSYLPEFLERHHKSQSVVCVVGQACRKVAQLFGHQSVVEMTQVHMDETVQGVIYSQDSDCFIAHHDRPYVVYLHWALYARCIPLRTIYCCGVFGLPQDTVPAVPMAWKTFNAEGKIEEGNAVILSPYAKSVTALPKSLWDCIVRKCREKGLQVLTNVAKGEDPLPGTEAISPDIAELRSAVEQAGIFVGIRSGLCDVLQTAKCRKVALYPDYFYCDTQWKAIDLYSLPNFKNIVVNEELYE